MEDRQMNIQWYPGHMTKTRRQIETDLKLVDAVCEIVDARIPISSRNPDIDSICAGKPRLIILNRMDLADSAATKIKNDLLNNAGSAYDTLKELGDLIDDNTDAISALETVATGKANASHTHTIADVSGLQSALDGKAASSHGTHVSYSSTAPVMDGTASVGSASTVARSDHKHPTDTSRASASELTAVSNLVGDTSVSDQITNALANFSSGKTLSEHLTEEDMILSSRQYGDELPAPGTPGRIFFLKVSE